ncbi:hypothetical protein CDV36_015716 [Fusarium kuroshium]|uniref:Uncharacterized protein n=1 Tax=Fusarium kuroshium TaxID=2010991 RepID=A0A3M2R8J1_9HYPO|nr:hypothetical protein CDV36_015716 [Fusarium kuroshium]
MSDHESERETLAPSEARADEVTTGMEVSNRWKRRCRQIQRYAADCVRNQRPYPEGLTDRHLRIAEKISTLDETSEDDQDGDFGVQDESDTNRVPEERETEGNYEFAVSPEPSIRQEPVVQYDSELEQRPPPASVYRGTNLSTRKTRSRIRSTTPSANIQRLEAHKTSEISPQDIPVALRHSQRVGDPTLDGRSFSLTDAVIEFEAPQTPNIPPVAPRTHEAHVNETVAPRTTHGSAKIPRTVLGYHDQSHEQRRGLSARPPRTTVPIYEATQRRSSTFIAPVQAQEPYRHDRLSPMPPPVEAQTPKKARREAKASGRSRFG